MAERLSDDEDQFKEELETLQSIYFDNENFKVINEHSFTYKFSPEGSKDFVLQFDITPDYPDEVPDIHIDLLYNIHLDDEFKSAVVGSMLSEATQHLGVQMMYSLLEWGIDNLEEVVAPLQAGASQSESKEGESSTPNPMKVKKEHLTKAAKKKLADRTDATGERPRGWNWVDVIKHLSKTGPSQDPT